MSDIKIGNIDAGQLLENTIKTGQDTIKNAEKGLGQLLGINKANAPNESPLQQLSNIGQNIVNTAQNLENNIVNFGASFLKSNLNIPFNNNAKSNNSSNLSDSILQNGSTGTDVKNLQQALANLGFSPGDIDGDFGSQTQAALTAFQQAAGISADGIYGPETKAALNSFNNTDSIAAKPKSNPTNTTTNTPNNTPATNSSSNNNTTKTTTSQFSSLPNTSEINRLRQLANRPDVAALLNTIATTEGTKGQNGIDGYNVVVYGTVKDAPSDPGLVGKSNVKVPDLNYYHDIFVHVGPGLDADVSGRYQFQIETYHSLAKEIGLPEVKTPAPDYKGRTTSPVFTPEAQDLAAVRLLEKTGAIAALNRGDVAGAIEAAGTQWASLPTAGGGGIGDSTGQGHYSLTQATNIYQQALANTKNNPGAPYTKVSGGTVDGITQTSTNPAIAGLTPTSKNVNVSLISQQIQQGKVFKIGDKGEDVKQLKLMLGFKDPNGEFGKTTEEAVKAFQANNNIQQNGMVGKDTFAALKQATETSNVPAGVISSSKINGPLAISESGRRALNDMFKAGLANINAPTLGNCLNLVAGVESYSYINQAAKAGSPQWAKVFNDLFDRGPANSDEQYYTNGFAVGVGYLADKRPDIIEANGFRVIKGDGQTTVDSFLKQHPELKGAVMVVPKGQPGTSSTKGGDFFGPKGYGYGAGDIAVITNPSTGQVVADGGNGGTFNHNGATSWWIIVPK